MPVDDDPLHTPETIRSTPPVDGSGPGVVAAWRPDALIVFATGPEVRRFTLRRTTWGWDLTLHDDVVVLDDGIRSPVSGLSLAWAVPSEFWRRIEVIVDHDVNDAGVIAMLRGPGDPRLDALADELVGASAPARVAGAPNSGAARRRRAGPGGGLRRSRPRRGTRGRPPVGAGGH